MPTVVIRAKMWRTASAEPGTWDLTYTDTSASAITSPGGVGVARYLSSSATNAPVVWSWDTLRAYLPNSSVPVVSDDFGRTATNGWGTADLGGVYTYYGSGTNYTALSVNSGVGKMTSQPGNQNNCILATTEYADITVRATVTIDKDAVGGSQYATVLARDRGVNDNYSAHAQITTSGSILFSIRRGATTLANKTLAVTGAAGASLSIALEVIGLSATPTDTIGVSGTPTALSTGIQRTASPSTLGITDTTQAQRTSGVAPANLSMTDTVSRTVGYARTGPAENTGLKDLGPQVVVDLANVAAATPEIRWHVRAVPYLAASPRLRSTVRQSHVVSTIAYMWGNGMEGVEWNVVKGSLTVDGGADARRRATGTLVPPPGRPFPRADLEKVSVQNTEIILVKRYMLGTGLVENSLLGRLRIEEMTTSLEGGWAIDFSAYDMQMLVKELPLLTPYPAKQSGVVKTYAFLINDLIRGPFPQFTVSFHASLDLDLVPREDAVWEGSRWDAITEMAEAMSAVCYAARDGKSFVVSPYTTNLAPVEVLSTGPNGVLLNEKTTYSRKDIANGVLLTVDPPEGDLEAITVFVVDSDPLSPTYWGDLNGPPGPFGRKVYSERNDTITTEAAATAAAYELLTQHKGGTRSITFDAVPIPWLEPGDVIEVSTQAVSWGSGSETHVVDRLTIPLAGGVMRGETRVLSETQGGAPQ